MKTNKTPQLRITGIFIALILITANTFASKEEGTTWTGKKSTDWSDEKNWSNGLPDQSRDVTINEMRGSVINYPKITGKAACRAMTINFGGGLTMSEEGILTIKGDWIVDGFFDCWENSKVIFAGTTTLDTRWMTLGYVEITGRLTSTDGQLRVKGGWKNNGAFAHNGGTVDFVGSTLISGKSVNEFHNLIIEGSVNAWEKTIKVNGNWNNYGNFKCGTSTIIFVGTDTQLLNGTTVFYNLIVQNNSKTGVILKNNITATNRFAKKNGYQHMTKEGFNITLTENAETASIDIKKKHR